MDSLEIIESMRELQFQIRLIRETINTLNERQRKIKTKMNKIIKHINNMYIIRYDSNDSSSDICYNSDLD